MADTRNPSAAEWQRHEETIRSLYVVEDMTLGKVMAEMEKTHGFQASKSQYVSRLKKWGFRKNATHTVYETIGQKLKRKGVDVTDVTVCINEQPLPANKLKKELQRYSKPSWDISFTGKHCASPRTPEGVTIHLNGMRDDRLLWSPGLPFFDFLGTTRQLHVQGVVSRPNHSPLDEVTSIGNAGTNQVVMSMLPSTSGIGQSCGSISSDSRAIVTEWFNISPHLPHEQQEREFLSHVETLIIDDQSGDTAAAVQLLLGPESPVKPPLMMAYIAYLSTNGLFPLDYLDAFVRWALQQEDSCISSATMAEIISCNSLTAHAFVTHLMHSAARLNASRLVQFLLVHGVEVDMRSYDRYPRTPLQVALEKQALEVAFILIDSGADVNHLGCFGSTLKLPIYIASQSQKTLKIIPTLLEHGANVPAALRDRIFANIAWSILSDAEHWPEYDDESGMLLVKDLIARGADVNSVHKFDEGLIWPSPLQNAAYSNHVPMVRLLLESGAHPDGPVRPSKSGFLSDHFRSLCDNYDPPESFGAYLDKMLSPIALAARASKNKATTTEILDLLLAAGADVNANSAYILDAKGYSLEDKIRAEGILNHDEPIIFSALQAAVSSNGYSVTELLLRHGAEVDVFYGSSPIAVAARGNNTSMVQLLLSYGADVNVIPAESNYPTALTAAALSGNVENVSLLLKAVACVDHCAQTPSGPRTALQAAAEQGEIGAMRVLINAGAAVNTCYPCEGGMTALECAVLSRNRGAVDLLLDNGASINPCCVTRGKDITAVHAAIKVNDVALLGLFLCLGARLNEHLEYTSLPSTILTAARTGSEDIMRALVEAGADFNQPRSAKHAQEALRIVARDGNYNVAQILLQAGTQISIPPPAGVTSALGWAVKNSDMKMFHLFLEHGADLSFIAYREQVSLLDSADNVKAPNLEMATLLLQADINPNGSRFGFGGNPLVNAIVKGYFEWADLLITYGADINIHSRAVYETPLQAAVQHGHNDYAISLIERGADINDGAPLYRTALQSAVNRGDLGMVTYLISKGADVNAPGNLSERATALQIAATKGYLRIAQLLLSHGADIDTDDSSRFRLTVIDGAAEKGRLDMVKYLLDNYQGNKTKAELCEYAMRFAKRTNQWHIIKLLEEYPKDDTSKQEHGTT